MYQLKLGNSLEVLKTLEENSVDSIVTDPPYELGFMGKLWDSTGIANNVEMWKECLRVLKPGGYLLSFGGSRTHHRMMCAIEDAGFEIRDTVCWVFGSGFPKSLNIAKSIESKLKTGSCAKNNFHQLEGERRDGRIGMYDTVEEHGFRKVNPDQLGAFDLKATTQEAKQWEGWGTSLKPAHEPICMARKPLAEKTVAQNVLKYGTGGINIDESRVEGTYDNEGRNIRQEDYKSEAEFLTALSKEGRKTRSDSNPLGRFPANLIHDNSEEVRDTMMQDYQDPSRFFKSIIYQGKANKKDRGEYNNHPTVKPTPLMEYLVTMVTKKGGVVLDPFNGSGSTGVACVKNGFDYIGIDLSEEYLQISEKRIQSLNN